MATLGCRDDVNSRKFATRLARREVHCHDGAPLPEELHQRLLCDCERLALAEKQPAAPETAYYAQAANRRASVSISSHA